MAAIKLVQFGLDNSLVGKNIPTPISKYSNCNMNDSLKFPIHNLTFYDIYQVVALGKIPNDKKSINIKLISFVKDSIPGGANNCQLSNNRCR